MNPPLMSAIALMLLLVLTTACSASQAEPVTTQSRPATITPGQIRTQTFPATPARPATTEPTRPLLMVHFMPWYQTPEVSGYWGWHWTMDHFHPEQVDAQGRPDIASYVRPLTGPYDSSDDAVLEYQVLLMKLSGIDGVIVDWYGMADFRDYGVLNASTQKLFDAIKWAGLRFAVCYEDQSIKHMVENGYLPAGEAYSQGQAVMRYLEDTWFSDDAYLKANGQPALFIFGPQYFTRASDWETLFGVLPSRPAFFTLDDHTESAATAAYPWPPMWASKDGVLSQTALTQYLTGFYTKAKRWDVGVAGAFPGFHDIYQDAGVAAESRYLDPQQGETFRSTLQLALDQHPDIIQLITWNDYGETTSIEPTVEYGYSYLEVVQEARRSTDAAGFAFTADDLSLPLQLFNLRKAAGGDVATTTRLDAVAEALFAGNVDGARELLAEFPTTP